MQYTIIQTESMFEMTLAVQKCISEGWILQGGVSVCEIYGQVRYYQAMIKM